jgi:isochorismate synthase EntC
MKIKVKRVEESKFQDDKGKKWNVFDEYDEKHTTRDDFTGLIGQVVEVDEQTGNYNGKDWSKITLVKEKEAEVKEEPKTDKVPQEVWEKKDLQIIRQHSQEMAIRFFKVINEIDITKEDVVMLAEYFTDYVKNGLSEKTIQTIKNREKEENEKLDKEFHEKTEPDKEPKKPDVKEKVKELVDEVNEGKEDKINLDDIPF